MIKSSRTATKSTWAEIVLSKAIMFAWLKRVFVSLWLTYSQSLPRKTRRLSEAWWNVFLLVNHCISNLSHRSSFNPASFLSIALETLSMWVFLHLNAACIGVGRISVCQLITLPFCLCCHHRSWGRAQAAGGVNIYWMQAHLRMQEIGGVSQHLRWMVPSPFKFLFFSISAPKSCQSVSVSWPTIGSPLPTTPSPYEVGNQKHNNPNVSSGQPALFLVRKCSVCVCTHVWRGRLVQLRGGGGGVCVHIHI